MTERTTHPQWRKTISLHILWDSMTEVDAESLRLALLCTLRDTEDLLRENGEQHWASLLVESHLLIESRGFRGVELVYRGFSGMGSFNDLLLCSANGHAVMDSETEPVNDRLRKYQTKIYELVGALRHYDSQPDG